MYTHSELSMSRLLVRRSECISEKEEEGRLIVVPNRRQRRWCRTRPRGDQISAEQTHGRNRRESGSNTVTLMKFTARSSLIRIETATSKAVRAINKYARLGLMAR